MCTVILKDTTHLKTKRVNQNSESALSLWAKNSGFSPALRGFHCGTAGTSDDVDAIIHVTKTKIAP